MVAFFSPPTKQHAKKTNEKHNISDIGSHAARGPEKINSKSFLGYWVAKKSEDSNYGSDKKGW